MSDLFKVYGTISLLVTVNEFFYTLDARSVKATQTLLHSLLREQMVNNILINV